MFVLFVFGTVCEYYAHVECQDFAVPDCKENATYVPGKELASVKHTVSRSRTHTLNILIKLTNGVVLSGANSITGEKEIYRQRPNVHNAKKHAGHPSV